MNDRGSWCAWFFGGDDLNHKGKETTLGSKVGDGGDGDPIFRFLDDRGFNCFELRQWRYFLGTWHQFIWFQCFYYLW